MSKVFSFSTPVPLQPEFVDTMPPAAPATPRPATSHGQRPVATATTAATNVRPLISSHARCMELGLCQQRKPACNGCDHEWDRWLTRRSPRAQAPIEVDGPFKPARYRRAKLLAAWLAWLTVMGAASVPFIVAFGWLK